MSDDKFEKPGSQNSGGPGNPAARGPARLVYTHIYSDSDGVSHFREAEMSFRALEFSGMDDPPTACPLDSQPGAAFLRLAPGQVEDWHPAPRSVFLIAIEGRSRVTVGDGAVKEFRPGDVIFMDDTTGKGHITEPVGDVAHIALIVPVDAVKQ
jgi:mannose-6-phosphate isomerase-like protein (cupin superfamily)